MCVKRAHIAHLYLHIHSLNPPVQLKLMHQLQKVKSNSMLVCEKQHRLGQKQDHGNQ